MTEALDKHLLRSACHIESSVGLQETVLSKKTNVKDLDIHIKYEFVDMFSDEYEVFAATADSEKLSNDTR